MFCVILVMFDPLSQWLLYTFFILFLIQDVLHYLQPQFVVLCEVGQPPRVLENPNEAQVPLLRAELRGTTEPIRHPLVGSWWPKSQLPAFRISYKNCTSSPGTLRVDFEQAKFAEGGCRIDASS